MASQARYVNVLERIYHIQKVRRSWTRPGVKVTPMLKAEVTEAIMALLNEPGSIVRSDNPPEYCLMVYPPGPKICGRRFCIGRYIERGVEYFSVTSVQSKFCP